jgi:AcrR family transcriptional regulator
MNERDVVALRGNPAPTQRPTLRARRRAETIAEITDVARQHVAEHGLGGLSLRAVAREMGMAVSALYRYFPSRDDLVTALLLDAFTAQAEHVEAATRGHADPVAALRAAFVAFRAWSIARPSEYGLMYGSPLPGYVAPEHPLLAAGTRVAALLFSLVDKAERQGLVDGSATAQRVAALPSAHLEQLEAWRDRRRPETSLTGVVITVDLWTRLQGLVSLEVLGQLRPVLPDPGPYFLATADEVLTSAGFTSPR